MIKHIVMWKFKENTEKEREEFLERLLALNGVIPELKDAKIKRNVNLNGENYDAMLISTFDTLDNMEKYKIDPRHVKVSNLCKSIRISRASIDYEE